MSLTQVLIIEDDAPIRLGVCDALESAGYAVIGAESGEQGFEQLQAASFDLVLLDVVLPGRDGMSVLQSIRAYSPALPVIMLTARGDLTDRLRGLQLGADDYIVKPFNVRELLARVEAVLRRSPARGDLRDEVQLPDGRIVDFTRREICSTDGKRVELSEKETDLLRYLSTRSGRVVSRNELIEHIWQINPKGMQTRTVDMHISRLREKLGDDGDAPKLIVTVRGQGYRFESNEAES